MEILDTISKIGAGRDYENRDAATLLHEMDRCGVAVSVLCPPDAMVAVNNRQGNDLIARTVRDHPDRFIGYAVANPWATDAVDELRRALSCGLRGLFLYPPLQGFQLSDPLVDPLVGTAVESGVPIYAHTGTPVCAMPFQLTSLANRFPNGRFIMGHMGYADFWYDAAPAARAAPNISLETSLIDPDIIMNGVAQLGVARFVFGSAAPWSSLEVEIAKIRSLDLPDADAERILHSNAEALFA